MKKWLKNSISILLSAILILSVFTAFPFSASAAENVEEKVGGDDYPYSGTAAGVFIVDDWNFYRGECTSFCAWRLNHNNGIGFHNWLGGIRWGHAKDWDDAARSLGYIVNNTPSVGSIAYWEASPSSSTGHVAWVSNVYDNTIDIEEYNFGYVVINGEYYGNHKYSSRNIAKSNPSGYIHIKDINPNPPTNAWLSASTDLIPPGGSVSFTFGADGATDYYLGIDFNGNRYFSEGTWEGLWSGKSFTFTEPGNYSVVVSASNSAGWINSNWVSFRVVPQGHVMSEAEGAGPTIPDGDYWICSRINQNYFIDISGDNFNTKSGTNLNTWIWNNSAVPEKWDAFHFKYLKNGYYRITQINTKMAIDVDGASLYRGTNVQMWEENNSNAQQWSIEKTDKGYKLRSRANNYYLDVYGAYYENNTNVQVWTSNDSDAQFFGLIPYAPDERPIKDGIYTIKSQVGDTCYLDVSGEPGNYENHSNVQLWNWDNPDEKFQIDYVGNGYYRITEVSTERAVEIISNDENYLEKNHNAILFDKTASRGQFWKIKKNSDGTYFFINKLSGYYLDVCDGSTANGTNVHIHPYNGTKAQRWLPRRVLSDDMVTVNDMVTNSDATSVSPSVTVKVDGSVINSKFYSVKTEADIANGTGTVTVTGKETYCGSVTKTFNITINDTTIVNDFFGNKYETEKGEIITYYANLTSPIQVNHLNGIIYYNQEVLEPIIINDMSYFAPNFDNGNTQRMEPGQIRFDVYSSKPVSLNNTMIIRMQFRVIKKGGEAWLGHQFETPEFTYENRDNYELDAHILTKQALYDPTTKLIGDANIDGIVDILDATVIQKFAVNKITLTDEQKLVADVNNDGVVDILDATEIQKFAAGKITEFKKK